MAAVKVLPKKGTKVCEETCITIPLLLNYNKGKIYGTIEEDQISKNSHREGTASFFKTCFNGLNSLSGVGLLTVPYALSQGGWLSLVLLFIIAGATFFTGLLIRWCMDFDSQITTYPDIGERAFGNTGRAIVSIFMYLELYLVPTGFLILEGDNLYNMFPNMGFECSWISISGRVGFVIIVALIILPSVWLDDLSVLSYVSATGVLASIVIIGSVMWTGVVDQAVGFEPKGTAFSLAGIPTAFSLYTFCYCAHPVFPTLYTSMKDKSQFNKVLLVCFILCTAGYASMAVMGYMMFGENVKSQITLNLPVGLISSKIAIYTTLVSPLTKYALMVTPIVSAIETRLNTKSRLASLVIRTLLLISTVVVAIYVPFFGDLMSLVGSFLSATASIILPCVCYLKISRSYRRWSYELVTIVGIILMGISIVVYGTSSSLIQIIGHM